MKNNSLLILAVVAVATGGCAVGPNYQRPAVSAPTKWSEPLAGGETNSAIELAAWWENFHDAELNSLINRAVQSNLDLQIAQARVREARAQYGIAVANFLPTVDAAGSYARTETSHNQPVLGSLPIPANIPFENDVYQAGFDASWEIDVFGGTRRATEAARAGVAASEFGRRDTLVSLLGEVARNYIDVRGFQRRIAIANQNIDAQTTALAITHDRFAKGLTSDLDVQQASTLLATTTAEIPTLQTLLQAAIHRLGVLLGQQPGALLAEWCGAPMCNAPSSSSRRRPQTSASRRQIYFRNFS
jgi:NodT family efflux transporter outer membrane factor (OMF) lipoprotein